MLNPVTHYWMDENWRSGRKHSHMRHVSGIARCCSSDSVSRHAPSFGDSLLSEQQKHHLLGPKSAHGREKLLVSLTRDGPGC